METDLQVLQDRIQRLEALLGPMSSSNSACIHNEAKQLHHKLQTYVPDEMVAAKRAISMLTRATPSITSVRQVRKQRAANAEQVVDRAIESLSQLSALQQGETYDTSALAIDDDLFHQLDATGDTLSDKVVSAMREEERQVEALLSEFNSMTTQLNDRIITLAKRANL